MVRGPPQFRNFETCRVLYFTSPGLFLHFADSTIQPFLFAWGETETPRAHNKVNTAMARDSSGLVTVPLAISSASRMTCVRRLFLILQRRSKCKTCKADKDDSSFCYSNLVENVFSWRRTSELCQDCLDLLSIQVSVFIFTVEICEDLINHVLL